MRLLRDLEGVLVRIESALAVVLVLSMLTLAGYNVVYRNILVRLQTYWAHSGPPVDKGADEPEAPAAGETKTETPAPQAAEGGAAPPEPAAEGGGDDFSGFGGDFEDAAEGGDDEADEADEAEKKDADEELEGFGGDFGGDPEGEPEKAEPPAVAEAPPPKKDESDDFGGFGGNFEEDEEDEAPPPPKEPAPAPEKAEGGGADDFGGFGGNFEEDEDEGEAEGGGADDFGGFGGGAQKAAEDDGGDEEDADDDLGDDDFGNEDQFANLPDIDAVAKPQEAEGPKGGPPPAGSFAAWAIDFIDAIKLDWIDVLLRHLVIIVAFLGATLATQRGKHINIDALSKVLPAKARRFVPPVTNLVSVAVCLMLASAGWDLVQISLEYPKEVAPFTKDWALQLMFPVGFGLLAFHFGVRLVESIVEPPKELAKAGSTRPETVVGGVGLEPPDEGPPDDHDEAEADEEAAADDSADDEDEAAADDSADDEDEADDEAAADDSADDEDEASDEADDDDEKGGSV